jgi:D-tyrosyl-tRNA(Tyr) deacylase
MVAVGAAGAEGGLYVASKTKRLREDSKNTGALFSKYALGRTRQSL